MGNKDKQLEAFKKAKKAEFPLIPDEEGEAWTALGSAGTPTMVVATPAGKVLASHVGPIKDFDAFLKEIARILQTTLREVDTPARWGGEEFVVLSPNTTTENGLKAAERVRKAVADHVFPGTVDNRVTVSIGVAGIPHPSIDSQDKLIHAADLAMYEAKKNGRNRVELSSAL